MKRTKSLERKAISFLVATLLIAASFAANAVIAHWEVKDGHKMHYPQLPQGDHGYSIRADGHRPCYVADDWQCSESGPVTDIHFWGHCMGGFCEFKAFEIMIAEKKDPCGVGEILWKRAFPLSQVYVSDPIPATPQDWYDPCTGEYYENVGEEYWQYNIENIDDPFIQEKGEEYWLIISAYMESNTKTIWGWRAAKTEPFGCPALCSPDLQKWDTAAIDKGDVAFVITGEPGGAPCSITVDKKVSSDGGQTWHEEVIQCVCQNVQFKITVTNDGGSPITGVMVVDSMSECLTYEQGSATYFPDNASDNYIEWVFRSLQPGHSIEITYTAHVDCAGDLENSVSVEGECDGQVVHDEDEASVTGKECEPCLYSGRKMEMLISGQWDISNPSAGQWEIVNVIPSSEANSSAWGQRFPDLPWSYMYSGGASWVYGNTDWDDPTHDQHEYYRLQFAVPYNGNCVELHFAAYIDDGAIFYIDGPGYTPTLFYEHDPSESIYEHDPIEFVVDIDGVPGADCLQPGDYTIYIDHWDAEGVIYGLIFVADCHPCECECPECENEDRIIYVSSNATNTTWEDNNGQTQPVVEVNTPSGYTDLPLNPGCGAQWIWIGTNQEGYGWPVGTEELTTTFSIPQGYSVTTACLEISADDRADIKLNGQVVGSHEDLGGMESGWDDVSVIFISPSLFNSGTNELQITVEDVYEVYTAGIWCLQVCLVKEDSGPCLGTILIALLLSSGLFLVSRKKKRH